MSPRRELDLQFLEVVDLAIVGQHKSAVAHLHRLPRGVGQVDDRQPAMTEPDGTVAIMALAVRPAMGNDVGHCRQRGDRSGPPVAVQNSGYATHVILADLFNERR